MGAVGQGDSIDFPPKKKLMKILALVLFCPSELHDKTILLKIPHVMVVRYERVKLELSWKPSLCWLEDTIEAAG